MIAQLNKSDRPAFSKKLTSPAVRSGAGYIPEGTAVCFVQENSSDQMTGNTTPMKAGSHLMGNLGQGRPVMDHLAGCGQKMGPGMPKQVPVSTAGKTPAHSWLAVIGFFQIFNCRDQFVGHKTGSDIYIDFKELFFLL